MTETVIQTNSRDHAIDALRGIAIVCMIADHIASGGHILWALHTPNYLQGSSGFVLMSGFALGLVTTRRVIKLGWDCAMKKIWQRALQIFLIHVFLVLAMTDVGLITHGIRSVPSLGLSAPLVLLNVLILRWQPTFMDILPMYIFLLAAAPFAFYFLRRNLTSLLLMVSVFVYALTQFDLIKFSWMLPGMAHGFNLGGWQILFFVGLAAGYHRVDRWLRVSTPARNTAIISATILVVFSIVLARAQAGDFGAWRLLSPELEKNLNSKFNSGLLRTVAIFAGAPAFYFFITKLEEKGFAVSLLGFLQCCGRNSLFIFVGHFVFVALRFAIRAREWPPFAQDVWLLAALGTLYLAAKYQKVFIDAVRRGLPKLNSRSASQQTAPPA